MNLDEISLHLLGKALEEAKVMGVENIQDLKIQLLSEELVKFPVPPWVELGYCQSTPYEGYSGYPLKGFQSEMSKIISDWKEEVLNPQ